VGGDEVCVGININGDEVRKEIDERENERGR